MNIIEISATIKHAFIYKDNEFEIVQVEGGHTLLPVQERKWGLQLEIPEGTGCLSCNPHNQVQQY